MKLLNQIARDAERDQALRTIALEDELFHTAEAERAQMHASFAVEELDQTQNLIEALEDLSFVTDTIQHATPREAAMFHIATEAMFSGMNIPVASVVPALEDGEDGGEQSSKLRAFVDKVIETLKKIFEKVMAFIRSFITHFGKTIGNAHQRLQEAKERLRKMHPTAPKSPTVQSHPIQAGAFWCKTEQDVAKALIEYGNHLKVFAKDSEGYLTTVSDSLHSMMHEMTGQSFLKMFDQGEKKRLMNVIHAAAGVRASAKNPMHGQEETVLVHGATSMEFFQAQGEPLMGGRIIKFTYVKPFESGDMEETYQALKAVLTRCRYSVGHVDAPHEPHEAMTAGTPGGVSKLLEILGGTLQHLISDDPSSLGGAMKKVDKELARHSRALQSAAMNYRGRTPAGKAMLDCFGAVGRFYSSEAAKPLAELMVNTLRQFNLALAYVHKCLDNLGDVETVSAREATGNAGGYNPMHSPSQTSKGRVETAHVDDVLDPDDSGKGGAKQFAERVD